jgi:arsenate reductase (glutaredoxin)
MLKVYAYKNCDTCRKARKFLRASAIPFEEIPIRETPPTLPELRAMLAAHDGQIRRLFNTSGGDYKAQGLAERLPALPADEALALLSTNGNLVKRPFVTGDAVNIVGFDETRWREALG